jgi:uncharacterized MAPEG superfamily protein
MKRIRCLQVSKLYSAKTFLFLIQMVLLIGDDSDLRQAGGFLWVNCPFAFSNVYLLRYIRFEPFCHVCQYEHFHMSWRNKWYS